MSDSIASITVRPADKEIDASQVALWDRDPIHGALDPRWAEFGGAYIVGNPDNRDAIYTIADTFGVQDALNKGRIVRVDPRLVKAIKEPAPDADADKTPADGKKK